MNANIASNQDPDEALIAPFYDALRDDVLVVQKCNQCGQMRFPPLPLCSNCWSEDQSWEQIEPRGVLWSWVVYHRALSPAFPDVPYAIGRVTSTAGPTFTVRLDVPLDEIAINMPLRATFHHEPGQRSLLRFEKA